MRRSCNQEKSKVSPLKKVRNVVCLVGVMTLIPVLPAWGEVSSSMVYASESSGETTLTQDATRSYQTQPIPVIMSELEATLDLMSKQSASESTGGFMGWGNSEFSQEMSRLFTKQVKQAVTDMDSTSKSTSKEGTVIHDFPVHIAHGSLLEGLNYVIHEQDEARSKGEGAVASLDHSESFWYSAGYEGFLVVRPNGEVYVGETPAYTETSDLILPQPRLYYMGYISHESEVNPSDPVATEGMMFYPATVHETSSKKDNASWFFDRVPYETWFEPSHRVADRLNVNGTLSPADREALRLHLLTIERMGTFTNHDRQRLNDSGAGDITMLSTGKSFDAKGVQQLYKEQLPPYMFSGVYDSKEAGQGVLRAYAVGVLPSGVEKDRLIVLSEQLGYTFESEPVSDTTVKPTPDKPLDTPSDVVSDTSVTPPSDKPTDTRVDSPTNDEASSQTNVQKEPPRVTETTYITPDSDVKETQERLPQTNQQSWLGVTGYGVVASLFGLAWWVHRKKKCLSHTSLEN